MVRLSVRQNPDVVLVHYLNVPSLEDSGKCSPVLCADRHDSVRWSREDLLSQLKPMCRCLLWVRGPSAPKRVLMCPCPRLSPQHEVFAGFWRFQHRRAGAAHPGPPENQTTATHTCLPLQRLPGLVLVRTRHCCDITVTSLTEMSVRSVRRREHSPSLQHQTPHHLPQAAPLLLLLQARPL